MNKSWDQTPKEEILSSFSPYFLSQSQPHSLRGSILRRWEGKKRQSGKITRNWDGYCVLYLKCNGKTPISDVFTSWSISNVDGGYSSFHAQNSSVITRLKIKIFSLISYREDIRWGHRFWCHTKMWFKFLLYHLKLCVTQTSYLIP